MEEENSPSLSASAGSALGAVAGEASDIAGFVAFVAAIVAGRSVLATFSGWSADALREAYQRGSLWWHHAFTAKAKKALGIAGLVNAGFSLFAGVYALVLVFAIREEISTPVAGGVIFVWVIATLGLLGAILNRYRALRAVKPLSQGDLEDFLSTESLRMDEFYAWLSDAVTDAGAMPVSLERLVELMKQTGFDRNRLRELLEEEMGVAFDPQAFLDALELHRRDSDEQRAVLELRFGKKGELGMGTASLAVFSYLVNAGLVLGLASWLAMAGPGWGFRLGAFPKWWHLAALLILGIALLFIGGVVLLGALLLADTLAKNLLGYAGGLFRATWDIVLTAMPNITGNEAKELLPKVTFGQILPVFRQVAFSLPGKFLLGCIAFLGTFPHPFFWFVAVAAFIFIGFGGVTAEGFGNDITESMKATGRFIASVTLVITTYHIIEFLIDVGWVGDIWGYLDSQGVFWWWNRFTAVGFWTALCIAVLVLIGTFGISKIPDGKWMSRARRGLMLASVAVLVALVIGQIAHVAGADAYLGDRHPATQRETLDVSVRRELRARQTHARSEGVSPSQETRRLVRHVVAQGAPRRPSVQRRQHPSLGVAPVPPIPSVYVPPVSGVASREVPSCDSLRTRTASYRELARRMGRCR